MICHRDVSMESRGAGEFSRHFFGKRHWLLDITYRVQNNLPTYNHLMDPMELSATQIDEYMKRPRKGKAEGFSFPEDLLPACTQVDSSIPLMTLINCLLELLRSGGYYTPLRKLWGCFRATLGPEDPLFNLNWSHPESLVSEFFDCFIFEGGAKKKRKNVIVGCSSVVVIGVGWKLAHICTCLCFSRSSVKLCSLGHCVLLLQKSLPSGITASSSLTIARRIVVLCRHGTNMSCFVYACMLKHLVSVSPLQSWLAYPALWIVWRLVSCPCLVKEEARPCYVSSVRTALMVNLCTTRHFLRKSSCVVTEKLIRKSSGCSK